MQQPRLRQAIQVLGREREALVQGAAQGGVLLRLQAHQPLPGDSGAVSGQGEHADPAGHSGEHFGAN